MKAISRAGSSSNAGGAGLAWSSEDLGEGSARAPEFGRSDDVWENRSMVAWFALTVAPRKEKAAAQTLRANGFEEFLPLYSAKRQWSDRVKTLDRPLFPGYVFCRFTPRQRQAVLKTPCVVSIVSFGRLPEPIEDSEIAALQAVCQSGLPAKPHPNPEVGSRVRLHEGPLRGLEGILVEDKQTRLILSLTLLQRSVAVEIERAWIEPPRTLIFSHSHVMRAEGQSSQ